MATTTNRVQPAADVPQVQLATRIPASVLRDVKVWCVEHEVTVMEFITTAVREKLRRAGIRGV